MIIHVKAQKPKALVLIDDANIYYGFKGEGWQLDYEKFKDWLDKQFEIIDIYFLVVLYLKRPFSIGTLHIH